MLITKSFIRRQLKKLIKESEEEILNIDPEIFINTFQPQELQFIKSEYQYKKAAIYTSSLDVSQIPLSTYIQAISSELLDNLDTPEKFQNFLEQQLQIGDAKLFLVPEYTEEGDQKGIAGSLPVATETVDVWEFDPSDTTSSSARTYMAAAFLGTEGGAVGTIGEALSAALSIPQYGTAKWNVGGKITDCNASPWHANFPSVDLYVGDGDGTAAFHTPVEGELDGDGIYKIPGLFLSAKLSQSEPCYVELKYAPLARLFLTLLTGIPGTPNNTKFNDFNTEFAKILPDGCKEVHLEYGFANGGVSKTSASPEYSEANKGFEAGKPDPTAIVGVANLEERLKVGIKVNKRELFHNLISIAKNPNSPVFHINHEKDKDDIDISDTTQTNGLTPSKIPEALKTTYQNSGIPTDLANRVYYIKDLKTSFDQNDLGDIRNFIKALLAYPKGKLKEHLTAGNFAYTDDQIDLAIYKSLEFSLIEIAGLTSKTQKLIPSTQTAGMANLFLSDKCTIKLKRYDDQPNKFYIKLPGASGDEIDLGSKPTGKITSPEKANEQLGINFEAVCGVAFSGNLQTLVSDMNLFSEDQQQFMKIFAKRSTATLLKQFSPFQKIRTPTGHDTPQKVVPGTSKLPKSSQYIDDYMTAPLDDEDPESPQIQTLLGASFILKEINELFRETMEEFPSGSDVHKNVAIAFKKIYVNNAINAVTVSDQMTQGVLARMGNAATRAAASGVTFDQKMANMAYDISIQFISNTAHDMYIADPSDVSIEKLRGGILAATGIVGSNDFQDAINQTLNALEAGPPPLGDLLFKSRGIIPESVQNENFGNTIEFLFDICKYYLAGIAYAAKVGTEIVSEQEVRKYTADFLNAVQFEAETIEDDNIIQFPTQVAYNQEERTSQALNTQQSNISKGSVELKSVAESKIYKNILLALLKYSK